MAAMSDGLLSEIEELGGGATSVRGRRHMVSSVHYLATMSGLRILERGGNAIDAGVAAGICLNVLDPDQAMFGGVAPIIISLANGAGAPGQREQGVQGTDGTQGMQAAQGTGRTVITISGLGRWPRAATLEDYRARYGGDLPGGLPRTVTPAAPDAWLTALAEYGTLSLAEVLQPALELAEDGFPVGPRLRGAIASAARPGGAIARWPSTAEAYLPDGRVPEVGEVFCQPQLANTFRRLMAAEARAGGDRRARIAAARDLIYRGEMARQIAAFHQGQGGLLTEADLAEFRVQLEPPERTTYRGYDVYSCGPWCQGPSLLMALNLLEGFDLRGMGFGSAEYLHAVAEATKLAFADRHRYFGDPEFVPVPMAGLLSKEYAAARRKLIRPDEAWPEMPPAGDPWAYQAGAAGSGRRLERLGQTGRMGPAAPAARPGPIEADTRYVCVIDSAGNGFSATPSDSVFGSPVIPGLGFAISSRGTQTWLDADHPSRLEPWKRPRLTPNPALAHKDGDLYMTFGCPGGDAQVQGMLQTFLNAVEFEMEPQAAIAAPRVMSRSFPNSFWPHVYHPGRLEVETRFAPEVRARLAALGHRLHEMGRWASGGAFSLVSAIVREPGSGTLVGGADPRGTGLAAGW